MNYASLISHNKQNATVCFFYYFTQDRVIIIYTDRKKLCTTLLCIYTAVIIHNDQTSQVARNVYSLITSKFTIIHNWMTLQLQELSETNGNFFISPASIKASLAMILEGAYGKCAEEIKNALRLRLDQSYGKNQVQALLNDLNVREQQ